MLKIQSSQFILPKEKPNREMSAAMERIYTDYAAPQPQHNELFSQFKYTELKGFDYNNHDGTISWDVPLTYSGLIPDSHFRQMEVLAKATRSQ